METLKLLFSLGGALLEGGRSTVIVQHNQYYFMATPKQFTKPEIATFAGC